MQIVKNKLKGSNILVTGGCGFIGSHLARKLANLGVGKITIIDSLEYGKKENLENLLNQVEVVKYWIGSRDDAVLAEKLKGVDYLFHLAAEKHNQSVDNPFKILESNVNGTLRLFELASQKNVKKVFFSSSLYVYGYGRGENVPFDESRTPSPVTVYGISKLAGEQFLKYCYEKYNLRSAILRFFFVYGPRQFSGTGYKSVIIKNFERMLCGENPMIFGNGEQSLDYIFVDDIVDGIIKSVESDYNNETFNIGNAIPVTINHLTDVMLGISKGNFNRTYGPADITHNTFRVADTSKIEKMLGFKPTISLEEGLRRTYNWMCK